LKKKGFKKERVTKVGVYDLGTSTTLESNKSHPRKSKVPFLGVAPGRPAGFLNAINAVFVGWMVKP